MNEYNVAKLQQHQHGSSLKNAIAGRRCRRQFIPISSRHDGSTVINVIIEEGSETCSAPHSRNAVTIYRRARHEYGDDGIRFTESDTIVVY